MRILCVCDQGNNRSVVLAHQLKYLGHDCLPVGLKTNSPETLTLLYRWADRIVTTDATQQIPPEWAAKAELWNVGPDHYPRPFNKELLGIVRGLVERHRSTLSVEPRAA